MELLPVTEISKIEDRISRRLGSVNAATAELVDVIIEVLDRQAWQGVGIRGPEQWVAWKCAVTARRARQLVEIGRVLPELPACRALFAQGRLTEDHVAVICRYTLPAHDAEVAELAPGLTPAQLSRALRTLPRRRDLQVVDQPETETDAVEEVPPSEGDTHLRRSVSFGFDDDGNWRGQLILPPDEGAVVEKALELARQELFDAGRPNVGWSDATVHLASVAIDTFADPNCNCHRPSGKRRRRRRGGGERFLVVLHQRDDDAHSAELHLGPALPDSLRRYLTCDATVRWVLDRDGNPHKVARTHRTVPDWLRTLITDRDQHCRVPGCGQHRWLHVHHVIHWEDGGETVPENLVALCPFHHREHHLGRLPIRGDPTTPTGLQFTDGNGRPTRPIPARSPAPGAPRPTGTYRSPYGERLNLYWLHWSSGSGRANP